MDNSLIRLAVSCLGPPHPVTTRRRPRRRQCAIWLDCHRPSALSTTSRDALCMCGAFVSEAFRCQRCLTGASSAEVLLRCIQAMPAALVSVAARPPLLPKPAPPAIRRPAPFCLGVSPFSPFIGGWLACLGISLTTSGDQSHPSVSVRGSRMAHATTLVRRTRPQLAEATLQPHNERLARLGGACLGFCQANIPPAAPSPPSLPSNEPSPTA